MHSLDELPLASDQLYITTLGGYGHFGMNCTIYHMNSQCIVVDTGIMFADPARLGTDSIVPDFNDWFRKFGHPKAYFITHGHEDHYGGIAFFIRNWPAKVYCSSWTAALIQERFERLEEPMPSMTVIKSKDQVNVGAFELHATHLNHSIPMNLGYLVKTKHANVFHTGDYKVEESPLYEQRVDTQHLDELAKQRIDLFIGDSTNAHIPGRCPGEGHIIEPLRKVLRDTPKRIFLATFSSNFWRIKTILRLAQELNRRVYIDGAGLRKTLHVAQQSKMIDEGELDQIVGADELDSVADKDLLVICTGCQGEGFSALGRMIRGDHRQFRLQAGDKLILSSRIIPGNERAVFHVISEATKQGAQIVTTKDHPDIHVSGHGYQDDIAFLHDHLKPAKVLPAHGTFVHMKAQAALFKQDTVPQNGSIYSLQKAKLKLVAENPIDWLYVDAYSKHLLDRATVKERWQIGEKGLAIISGVYSTKRRRWEVKPDCELRGLDALPKAYKSKEMTRILEKCLKDNSSSPEEQLEKMRIKARLYLSEFYTKKIVVYIAVHTI